MIGGGQGSGLIWFGPAHCDCPPPAPTIQNPAFTLLFTFI